VTFDESNGFQKEQVDLNDAYDECDIQVIRNIDTRFSCGKYMLAMVYVCSTKE
jgi:hypothetical protein